MSDHSKEEEQTGGVKSAFDELDVAKVTKKDDVAGAFLAEIAARPDAAELLAPWTPAEEKHMLRWKVDPIIMTLMQFLTMMGAVDKVCIGTAAIMGLREDLNLQGQEYSHMPAGKWMSANCMAWGIILCASAACKDFGGLMAARFILGLFEAIIFAGAGLIVAMWWKRPEQPWRTAVIFSTLSSIMNGLLSYASIKYTGSLKQWQVLFLLVGAVTFAWSLLCFWLLPNSPVRAWWLTDRQKVIAVNRTAENRTGVENKVFKWGQVKEAFLDPRTHLHFLVNLTLNVPNSGLTTFNSVIINSLGFSKEQTILMALPTGVISWVGSIIFAFIAVRSGRRCLTAAVSVIPPMIGTIVLTCVPRSNRSGSLGGLYCIWLYWSPYIVMQTVYYANTGGYTKKLTVYGWAYIGYCVGCLVGPQTFKANEAPGYRSGIIAMLSCYGISIVLIFLIWAYTAYLNRKKKAQLAEYLAKHRDDEDLVEPWHDQTDWENPRFVYLI
ncbi:hypothetical protein Rhopal_007237-T1 [Rhodotorula paludigena]|uniref:Allantoate permease n=1 Tax=Rhodotorula paludigena TaxID=86838 RepID=A0AAV5H089_9BASI|nr:hypothetical protein Rhopal_007237-T1 [Rhodotorula paludigena]